MLGTIVLAVALFSRRVRPLLAKTVPFLRLIRVERPIRAAYEGIHAYRDHPGLLLGVFTLTLAVQTIRVLAIWLAGRAVGVDLSPRPYYVMGPLLFLVLLLPISVNGIAVRESFFVSFLGKLGVGRGRGLRDRLPVLRRDALPVGCPARCCSAGRACAASPAHAARWLITAKSASHFPRSWFVPSLRSGDRTIASEASRSSS